MGHNVDISQFADLLILKDKEVKANVKDALEQEEFERKMDLLKQEVAKQEEEIKQVQKNLKEAERILVSIWLSSESTCLEAIQSRSQNSQNQTANRSNNTLPSLPHNRPPHCTRQNRSCSSSAKLTRTRCRARN